jgi:deoxyribodipyrimidine photolyase-related protein
VSGGRTAWILGDQLSHENPALAGADRVLLVESRAALMRPGLHRQKVHLVLSAMRHFAAELRGRGIEVDLRVAPTFRDGLAAHRAEYDPEDVALLEPASAGAHDTLGVLPRVRLVRGALFVLHPEDFRAWAAGRKRLRMEDFYRWQRRRLEVLMDGSEPTGGRWNLDTENRRPPPRDHRPPEPATLTEDEIDAAVRRDLDALDLPSFGTDTARRWPATRAEARAVLDRFVAERLRDFGPWQDAMLHGERWMWHAHLSSSLNLGLISPLECVEAVEDAYRAGGVPLASAEGFIRQVIGWREYVWGTYWLLRETFADANALGAEAPLPALFWGEPTDMRCLSDVVDGLRTTAYAHHIERLMLFGNLMLLLGVAPRQAVEWFRVAFIDGYEWVMEPNVVGMALWADGGRMMTKPYAASGRYVNRMSDHCRGCRYDPTARTGPDACPYTTLYWAFLDRTRLHLEENRRMTNAYRNLDRIPEAEMNEIRTRGQALRENFTA